MDAKEVFQEAQLHLMQGRKKESIESFTKALDAGFSPAAMAYLARGVAHLQLKEHDPAMRDFTSCIDAKTSGFRAYYYRGTIHMIKEQFVKAIEDFSKAIEINPDHAASFFCRGTCYAHIEEDEKSSKDIRIAMANSDSATQGFMDSMGMMRTQFDKVMALMLSEREDPATELSEKEKEKLRQWMDEEE